MLCRGLSWYEAEVVAVRAKKKLKAVASGANPIGKSELVAWVELRHYHHVEQWGTEREALKQEGQSQKGAVLRDETRRDAEDCYKGPLAPEEGQRPYSNSRQFGSNLGQISS